MTTSSDGFDTTLIRSDEELLQIALGYFSDYAATGSAHHAQPYGSGSRSGHHDQDGVPHPSPSVTNRRQQYRQVQDDPDLFAQHLAAASMRRAERWLHTLQQHNRDLTFSPAICKQSLDLARTKITSERLPGNVVERLYSDDVAKRRENESERELQAVANRMLRQSDLLAIHRSGEDRNNKLGFGPVASFQHQHQQQHHHHAPPTPLDGQRASERLFRRASLPPSSHVTSSRAVTPRNTTHHHHQQQQQQRSKPSSTGDGVCGGTPMGESGALAVGGDSPVAMEPHHEQPQQKQHHGSSSHSQQQSSRMVADPSTFIRLYSDAARQKEALQQKIAEATHINMKKVDDVDAVVYRVSDQAIMERLENEARIKKANAYPYRPELCPASCNMVVARNSAAGDVFHRLQTKPHNSTDH